MASTATTGDVAVGAEVDPQPADVAVVADAEANGADHTEVDTAAGDAVVAANGDGMTQRHAGKPAAAADEAMANGNGHGGDGEDQEEDDAEEYAGTRSRSISQALDTIAGVTASKRRIKLGFENIQFKVGNKQILNGVSGAIRPGGLCAIMGKLTPTTLVACKHAAPQSLTGARAVMYDTAIHRPIWCWQEYPVEHPGWTYTQQGQGCCQGHCASQWPSGGPTAFPQAHCVGVLQARPTPDEPLTRAPLPFFLHQLRDARGCPVCHPDAS